MALQRTIKAYLKPAGRAGYVAESPELNIVTHGASLDEVVAHLRERVERTLEGEDLARWGLAPSPVILISFEIEPQLLGPEAIREPELVGIE